MQIEENVDLKQYNTLQIPVNAKYFAIVESEYDILELMETDLWKKERHCILNGGSNILFTHDFDGIVVKIGTKGKELIKSDNGAVLIEVAAGENWSDFVEWCCENNYC
jgi:UDP-N-acetylmuramate dehydrogenase